MKKNRFNVCLVVILIFSLFLTSCGNNAGTTNVENKDDEEIIYITWGTGSLGGSIQMVATAISTVVNKNEPNYKITAQATGGSLENVRLFRSGLIDICHTTEGAKAYLGMGPFKEEGPLKTIMSMFTCYGNETTLVAMADNVKVTTIDKLHGLNVCIGPSGAGIATMSENYLKAMGYDTEKDFNKINMAYNDSVEALRDGTIDVLFMALSGKKPTSYQTQLQTTAKLKILDMDTSAFEALFEMDPDIATTSLPAGALDCLDHEYITFANFSTEYCSTKLSEDVVYTILDNIYNNSDELSVYTAQCSALTIESAMDGFNVAIPVHPGAAKFFKEKGIWDDAYTIGSK